MLLGQNVNSYGKTLEYPMSFAELLRKVNDIDGLQRIRFMTSHPKDLSDELIEAMAECKKVCHHLHLPLQSGSSRILKQMNRRYTKEQYLDLVDRIRQAVPDISLTTDIIVGFPGETEEEFATTEAFLEKIHFYEMHIFKYSKRQGTRAAVMENQVPEEIKTKRSAKLLALSAKMSKEFREYYLGSEQEVLFEEQVPVDGTPMYVGYTKEYVKVAVQSEEKLDNVMKTGKITAAIHDDLYLMI